MTWQWASIGSIWVLTVLGAIAIALVVPASERFTFFSIALAGAVFATFVMQLAIQVKEGFVSRVMASVGGSALILAVLTLVLYFVG